MKRYGNLYEKVCSLDNLRIADKKARIGKTNYSEIKKHDLKKEENLLVLHTSLINNTYKTSHYSLFKVYEPKERIIYKLPYYPDRIVHHAIMNILEPIFVSTFTTDTYACIKARGIHKAFYKLKEDLKNKEETQYCLKLDIKKFYPSINHDILKFLLKKKIKDKNLLNLLFEIIDSAAGVPIGNYLSQYFANFYLAYFDHWLKEKKGVKYYYRYCDDLVILDKSKAELHSLFKDIKEYLEVNLKLNVKSNYQVFPVNVRGIDFVGYRFFHTHILVRKRIKNRFKHMILHRKNKKSINAYYGWFKPANSVNLLNKYLNV